MKQKIGAELCDIAEARRAGRPAGEGGDDGGVQREHRLLGIKITGANRSADHGQADPIVGGAWFGASVRLEAVDVQHQPRQRLALDIDRGAAGAFDDGGRHHRHEPRDDGRERGFGDRAGHGANVRRKVRPSGSRSTSSTR